MDIGVAFPASTTQHEAISLAESLGYTHAWLDDSHMLFADPYVSLALAAERTGSIRLGVGVTNPSTRIAPVTANAIATVNRLAPGRVILGIGTGNTALRVMGLPPARIGDLGGYVDVVRGLLTGAGARYVAAGRENHISFPAADAGWIDISTPVPIWVAGSGPRALELAGERGDGVILFGTVDPDLIRLAMDRVRRGAERAGRRIEDVPVMTMTTFCLLDDGESVLSDRVIRRTGPFVSSCANILALSNPDASVLPAHLRDDVRAFREIFHKPASDDESAYSNYATGLRPDVVPLLTERLIRATTLTGTPAEVRASLTAMEDAGVGYVSIRPVEDVPGTIRSFAEIALG